MKKQEGVGIQAEIAGLNIARLEDLAGENKKEQLRERDHLLIAFNNKQSCKVGDPPAMQHFIFRGMR